MKAFHSQTPAKHAMTQRCKRNKAMGHTIKIRMHIRKHDWKTNNPKRLQRVHYHVSCRKSTSPGVRNLLCSGAKKGFTRVHHNSHAINIDGSRNHRSRKNNLLLFTLNRRNSLLHFTLNRSFRCVALDLCGNHIFQKEQTRAKLSVQPKNNV